ncbi:hypothetical protein [Streptomyces sp. I05A-00742]|uniref:hypothetical protein n=1 Tax=Streptomyces sp. I05A-00742 TaxID=2732853 RepID=UPI001489261F|nr:hypothetical protein [Streptomyces sp. I05A-00742]
MATNDLQQRPARPLKTDRPVPRWAQRTARLLPWMGLPVCLWRLPIGFDFTMGMDMDPAPWPRWLAVGYVVLLSLLSETFALLCSGLVRPWGEVFHDRVPVFRGRRIPPAAVVVPATLAGLAFSALLVQWFLVSFELAGFHDMAYDNVWWHVLAVTVSGLCALWGPLVLALTWAYWRRRRDCPAGGGLREAGAAAAG